MSCIHVM